MKKKFWQRSLSLFLAFVMVFTLPGMQTFAYNSDNAAPATDSVLDGTTKTFAATSDGSFLRIIDGELWVWGSNVACGLGIAKDADGNAATTATVIASPMKHDFDFNGTVEEIMTSANDAVTALVLDNTTGKHKVYAWGTAWTQWSGGTSSSFSNTNTPQEWDLSEMDGDVVWVFPSTTSIAAKTDQGTWYMAGGTSALKNATGITANNKTFKPVVDSWLELVGGNDNIEWIKASYGGHSGFILTKDDKLYAWGGGPHNQNFLGNGSYSEPTDVSTIEANADLMEAGPVWDTLNTNGHVTCVLDKSGNAWLCGYGGTAMVTGSALSNIISATPAKVYNADMNGAKAVRAYVSSGVVAFLAEDNSLYAIGKNMNQFISTASSESTVVTTATQVFTDLSKEQTITGVYTTSSGVMVVTQSGELYYAGDNSRGAAGDGTTTSAAAGTVSTVVQSTVPPIQPLTTNGVYYEIELTENNKSTAYRPMTDSDGNAVYDSSGQMLYNKTVAGSAAVSGETLTVDAGVTFKLNVYFNDFGKINAFILPIRYNPDLVKVVNGSGTAYSDTVDFVSPGALGSSVGIEQCFTIQNWPSGSLVAGVYPKISNADGWVSVSGISYDSNPAIDGEVKMFSISFRAQTTSSAIKFDIATPDNVTKGLDGTDQMPVGNGYDATAVNSSNEYGAWWMVYNQSGGDGATGYFSFNFEPFPAFSSKLVNLKALDMTLTYGDNNTKVATSGEEELEAARQPGWTINWSNTSVVYTVTANPYSDANKTTSGASFPQVNWSLSLDNTTTENSNNGDRTLEDYISVLYQGDTYMQFTVNPNFTPIDDEDPGYIKITATSKVYSSINTAYTLKLRSYEAPAGISIVQGNDTSYTDVSEVIYHYTNSDDENKAFHALVTDKNGNVATNNTEVVWSLLDSEGNTITSGDTSAAVIFNTVAGKEASILPKNTTTGDSYVTLRVESLYDANVYDEVKIKVQLYATQLSFSVDTIRMAVEKDGIPSSVDLAKYLQVTPVDVYATDYSWTITGTPTADPANATDVDPGFVTGTSVLWGSLGSGSDAAVFNAFEWATPTANTTIDGFEQYVTVTVKDSYSGETADIKIAILDLNSPIGIDQFTATNNLGYTSDTLLVKSGLEVGMKLQFYPTYDDALSKTNQYSSVTIVDGMTPYFQFTVGNKEGSLYGGAGGFIGVIVVGKSTDGNDIYYDPVPVPYDAEPSLVDGYIHLYGKESGSVADESIRIDMVGPDFKETVYTNKTGYFKFTKYIAPGSYTMTISRANYLTRVVGMDITQTEDGEFHISTSLLPINIYPGELTGDNAITVADISLYATNWYGLYDNNITNFDSYDFVEDGFITMEDLALVMMRKDWISGSYAKWSTATK